MDLDLELKVAEALADDVGKGWARLDPEDIKALSAVLGDLIEVQGAKKTVARITGTFPEFCGKKMVQIDGITRSNAQANVGEAVRVKTIPRKTAATILVTPLDLTQVIPEEGELEQFAKVLQGLPAMLGDKINIPFLGGKERLFRVEATSPSGGVIINQKTRFLLKKPDFSMEAPSHISYEDVGGLGDELRLVREMVELPLRYAEAFERLGIEAPKGVLLYGPPGTGKTLIARAIASETKLHFIRVNGPEIIHKFYGESEARLREIFEEATRKASRCTSSNPGPPSSLYPRTRPSISPLSLSITSHPIRSEWKYSPASASNLAARGMRTSAPRNLSAPEMESTPSNFKITRPRCNQTDWISKGRPSSNGPPGPKRKTCFRSA